MLGATPGRMALRGATAAALKVLSFPRPTRHMNVNPNNYPSVRGNLQQNTSGAAGRPVEQHYESGGTCPKCDEEILFSEGMSTMAVLLFLKKSNRYKHRSGADRHWCHLFGRTKVEFECPAWFEVHYLLEGLKMHEKFVNQHPSFFHRRFDAGPVCRPFKRSANPS